MRNQTHRTTNHATIFMNDLNQQQRSILVVDDSKEMVHHLASTLLPRHGFRSSYALDGRTALQKVREERPDLIILDLNLPQMTGLDVLEALAEEQIAIPVVLITGEGSEKAAIDAFRLGAKDYIVKPFTMDEVVNAVESTLGLYTAQTTKGELEERLFVAHNMLRRLRARYDYLLQMSRTLLRLNTHDQIIKETLHIALEATGAEEASLYLQTLTQNSAEYTLRRHASTPSETETAAPVAPAVRAMQDLAPVRESDFLNDITLSETQTARAILYTPLQHDATVLGAIGVRHTRLPRAFSEQDELCLSTIAEYAAIALHNADRIAQARHAREREHSALVAIMRAMVEQSDAQQMLTDVGLALFTHWPVEVCRLWIVDNATGTMDCVVDIGVSAESRKDERTRQRDIIVHQVAERGRWMFRNELTQARRNGNDDVLAQSMLCVPLLFHGTIVGVLQLQNKMDGPFDEDDVRQAQEMADAVALAVADSHSRAPVDQL